MTLGKRIAEKRKAMNMTQDALAKKLGVTAQAVSKWENDQSCPDISVLPKLADLLQISLDELLGREQQKVHTAEVVGEEKETRQEAKGMEFRWDSGRRGALGFAVFVLLVGGMLLCAHLLQKDAGLWDIAWPSALLVFGIWGLFPEFSFLRLGSTLFGAYFLASNMGFLPFQLKGNILLPALIILFGLSLLADAIRKPKKGKFFIKHSDSAEGKHNFSMDDDSFECSLKFGDENHRIDVRCLESGDVNCSFGSLTIDLSGCESVSDDCEIDAECSFGELVLRVPRRFRVVSNARSSFGSVSTKGSPDPEPSGTITLNGSVSFGAIEIEYI